MVCGLTTAQITRAKRKITDAGIPYRIPADDELNDRLREVLTVIYLLFNEGYLASSGDAAQHRDLVEDAEWLAVLLDELMPHEPEVTGLLKLIRLHRARAAARFNANGTWCCYKTRTATCGTTTRSPPPPNSSPAPPATIDPARTSCRPTLTGRKS